jgi:hypothetical protein
MHRAASASVLKGDPLSEQLHALADSIGALGEIYQASAATQVEIAEWLRAQAEVAADDASRPRRASRLWWKRAAACRCLTHGSACHPWRSGRSADRPRPRRQAAYLLSVHVPGAHGPDEYAATLHAERESHEHRPVLSGPADQTGLRHVNASHPERRGDLPPASPRFQRQKHRVPSIFLDPPRPSHPRDANSHALYGAHLYVQIHHHTMGLSRCTERAAPRHRWCSLPKPGGRATPARSHGAG